jgi:hypothetical protein
VLEVIEHQQGCAIAACHASARGQIERGHIRQTDGLGDSEGDERRVANSGQRYEHDAGHALARDPAGELESQPSLPGSARAGQRDEPGGRLHEPAS